MGVAGFSRLWLIRAELAGAALLLSAADACSGAQPQAPAAHVMHAAGSQSPDGFVLPTADAAVEAVTPLGACNSTFLALARMIFVQRGCVANTCHTTPGPDTPAAGLDLTEADAYRALVDAPVRAPIAQPLLRVKPGDEQASFLYLKLAAAEVGGPRLASGGGGPMPLGRPPLSAEALAAVATWIRAGAPETGVVADTEALVAACQQATP